MVDLALLHSRKKEIKEPEQETTLKTTNNTEEYMVFICATMWHESRKEMEKILSSIKRYSHTHIRVMLKLTSPDNAPGFRYTVF